MFQYVWLHVTQCIQPWYSVCRYLVQKTRIQAVSYSVQFSSVDFWTQAAKAASVSRSWYVYEANRSYGSISWSYRQGWSFQCLSNSRLNELTSFAITTSSGSLFHTWPTLAVKKFFRRLSLAPLMKMFLLCPLVCSLPLDVMGITSLSYIPAIILKISIMSPSRRLTTNVGRPVLFRRSEYYRCFRSGTCFVALLCTLSNSVISVFLYGAHTATAVSWVVVLDF